MMNELREKLMELSGDGEGLIFFDPPELFDPCILGIARRIGMESSVAYDQNKVLERMAEDFKVDSDDPIQEAIEWFEYNTAGSYLGERTPIFIEPLEVVCQQKQ